MSSVALPTYRRLVIFEEMLARLVEPRRFIQVIAGPRQVGKTTLARQVLEAAELPSHYASADEAVGFDIAWIRAQWEIGRRLVRERSGEAAVLVLDEVQKVPRWSDTVKGLWDEDSASGLPLHVVALGSSPLLVRRGLTESLAGRFEVVRVRHWSFTEMRDAFGLDLEQFLFFGGYPGAAGLVGDEARWRSYVLDSLVETTISRDLLLTSPIGKPALLRRLFGLACEYSGQILSYTKMLGQLHDAGNTTTLAHYLDLLDGAGMICGLQKFSGSAVRRRASSPKLIAHNTGLVSAVRGLPFASVRSNPQLWGRLVETAIGAHLLNHGLTPAYWRERNREVDFVLETPQGVTAIEVTSGRRKEALPGLDAFLLRVPEARPLLVGAQGVPLEEFFANPPERWLG
ncbi:MAG: ATPase [Thermoleophilia bacterium]|nr:ATPase [Thermoleophilia bacterium]